MEITKEEVEDILIFYIDGKIDMYCATQAKDFILNEVDNAGMKKIIINLKDVDYLDSSGIGSLVNVYAAIRENGKMRICEIQEQVYSVLKLTGLIGFFQIDETEEESQMALESDEA
ncbi:MAG TPA: STAS domain-containing protein [Spirochaetota bacterium]|nr:STAS domain-containing protein [Spirochaetota bacterium]